jgi:hypothetical protein
VEVDAIDLGGKLFATLFGGMDEVLRNGEGGITFA